MLYLRKRVMVIGGLLLACVAVLFLQWTWPQEVVLADGATLALTQVKAGQTSFWHGTWLEKCVWSHSWKNGFHLGRFTVGQPEMVQRGDRRKGKLSLSLEFQILGTNTTSFNELTGQSSYRAYRVAHWGEDGYKCFEELDPFQKYRDGFFDYVTTTSFCRDSKSIHVQIQNRRTPEGPWLKLAEFRVKNPAREKEEWVPERYPVKRCAGDVSIELDGVRICPSTERTTPWRDISEQRIEYLFRVLVDGEVATNWAAHQIEVEDSAGDILFQHATKMVTNGCIIFSGQRSANLSAVWKIRAHLSPDSGFGETNLFSFRVPSRLPGPIMTNFQDLNTTISLKENMLAVGISKSATNSRLLFLSATDDAGESIKEFTPATGQYFSCVSLNMEGRSRVNGRVAIVRDILVEFVVKPVTEE